MKKDSTHTFEEILSRYKKSINHRYKQMLKRAKDKEFVLEEIINESNDILRFLLIEQHKEQLMEYFKKEYKRGESFEKILKDIKKEFGSEPTVTVFQHLEDGSTIELFNSEEEKELRRFAGNELELVRFFVRVVAYTEVLKGLPDLAKQVEEKENSFAIDPIIKWTGSKDNKNEFVQLIYGLHQAGLINTGKGEITKIVEALAEAFQVELSKNWQSNHSASIHKAKSNYEPPIFKKIKEAYKDYSDKLIEDKKKKS